MDSTSRHPSFRRYRKLLGVELAPLRGRESVPSRARLQDQVVRERTSSSIEERTIPPANLSAQVTTEIVEMAEANFPIPSLPPPAFAYAPSPPAIVGQIFPNRSGVSAWIIGDTLHLSIAPFRTRAECTDILSALLEVYDTAPHSVNWRVDLSSLDIIPLMLVGALVAYRGNLAARGHLLEIVVSPRCFHSRFFSGELRRQFAVHVVDDTAPRALPKMNARSL